METLFIHIPKCGGMSVRSVVGWPSGLQVVNPHWTPSIWRENIGGDRYDKMFKFTVVRDPVDRALSAWAFLHQQTPEHRFWITDIVEREYVMKYRSVGDMLTSAPVNKILRLEHFRLQTEWIDVGVEVFRLEQIDRWWSGLMERIGADCPAPPKINPSGGMQYHLRNQPGLRSAVREIYKDDYQQIGFNND